MRPRFSIRGCVRPSVGPSVRRSVRPWVGDAFAFRPSRSDLGPCIRPCFVDHENLHWSVCQSVQQPGWWLHLGRQIVMIDNNGINGLTMVETGSR